MHKQKRRKTSEDDVINNNNMDEEEDSIIDLSQSQPLEGLLSPILSYNILSPCNTRSPESNFVKEVSNITKTNVNRIERLAHLLVIISVNIFSYKTLMKSKR